MKEEINNILTDLEGLRSRIQRLREGLGEGAWNDGIFLAELQGRLNDTIDSIDAYFWEF